MRKPDADGVKWNVMSSEREQKKWLEIIILHGQNWMRSECWRTHPEGNYKWKIWSFTQSPLTMLTRLSNQYWDVAKDASMPLVFTPTFNESAVFDLMTHIYGGLEVQNTNTKEKTQTQKWIEKTQQKSTKAEVVPLPEKINLHYLLRCHTGVASR